MYPNKQVTELRKSGRLQEALETGIQALNGNPDDLWLKRAIAWVYYDYIKEDAAQLERLIQQPRSNSDIAQLVDQLYKQSGAYAKLKLDRPDMAYSNITRVLTSVGSKLGFYLGWLQWGGLAGFSDEDRTPYITEKGSSSSLISKVAREAVAWRLLPENNKDKFDVFINALLESALSNPNELEENKIWIRRDRAKYQLLLGNIEAARIEMKSFLREKSREFWVWADLAEIERDSSELAIACLCQALLCKTQEKFTGRIHLNLAELLLEKGDTSSAIREYLIVAEIYEREGWKFPEDLELALQAPWFDSSIANTNQQALYQEHAHKAQRLSYENLREEEATFLSSFTPQKGNQRKALFAIHEKGRSVQVMTDAPWPEAQQPALGAPHTLTLGDGQRGIEVLGVEPSTTGEPWAMLEWRPAIVEHLNDDRQTGSLFIDRNSFSLIPSDFYPMIKNVGLGQRILVGGAFNPARERFEAVQFKVSDCISLGNDIKTISGALRVHEKGFAFVDDVFISPALVKKELDQQEVNVLCVYKKKPNTTEYGWAAVTLEIAPGNGK